MRVKVVRSAIAEDKYYRLPVGLGIRTSGEAGRLQLGQAEITHQAAQKHPKQNFFIGPDGVVTDDRLAIRTNAVYDPLEFRLRDGGHQVD